MTIRRTFELFIDDRSSYCSPRTLKKYTEDVLMFFRFLNKTYHISADDAAYSDLPDDAAIFRDYIVYLRQGHVSNSTIRSYARSIRAYLRFCYEEDYCPDYLKRVKLPRSDNAPKIPLCADEVVRIDSTFDLSAEKGKRNYCIVHLMLDCGLRRQEVIHLKCGDLIPEKNIITILDSKCSKNRFVLIPDFLLAAIKDYLLFVGRSSGFVFSSLRSGDPLTESAVKMLFQHLKEETGINRLHAHLLRHTFATSYLVGGGNLEFLRVFMGHTDYTVTKEYSSLAAQCKMLGTDIYKLDPVFFTRGY